MHQQCVIAALVLLLLPLLPYRRIARCNAKLFKMNRTSPRQPLKREKLRDIQSRFTQGAEVELEQWINLDNGKRAREGLVFGTVYIVGCVLVWLSGITSGYTPTMFTYTGVLFIGIAYNSLGLFIHEGLHGGLSRHKKNNMRWSFLIGIPLLISATAYRVTHTYHHIELGQARDYGTYRQHTKKRVLVWIYYYLQLLFGSFIYIACIPFLGYRHASKRIKHQIVKEYVVIGFGLAFAIFLLPTNIVVWFWLVPMLVMNVLTNIRGLASHALGDTRDPLLSSRTIKASPLLSWLLLYENYHLAHHLFPKVPSYHLKAVHNHIWRQVPRACWNKSYASFLLSFVKASARGDLEPLGYVVPKNEIPG